MKRLHAVTRDGTTFGMEVDGVHARRVINKAEYKEVRRSFSTTMRLCIPANQIASLMGEAAWLVTEKQDFVSVSFDDDPYQYTVIYPETLPKTLNMPKGG